MSIVDVENLRLHYARTLAHWGARFAAIDEQVRARYGETFRRAWELYLAGSEAAFAVGSLQLFQIVFAPMETAPPYWARARDVRRRDARSERPPAVMTRCDALIVGGGPAGSTCARVLRQAGWRVVVMDRARFPRDKVCAGWVTPGVFRLLDLDPAEYRATGLTIQTITGFRTSVMGDARDRDALRAHHQLRHPPVRVRRLPAEPIGRRRAPGDAARVARTARRRMDCQRQTSTARVVVGAGGHFCPVARTLLRAARA